MPLAIICDFDGTITTEDTGKRLLSELTNEDWRYYDHLVIKGVIGTREALISQYKLIKNIDKQDIIKIVDTIKIDQTFVEFYNWVKKNDVTFQIVSDGFVQNINRILENNGLSPDTVIIKANSFSIDSGTIKISFLTRKCEHGCANCKYSHVRELKDKGYTVVYIGDGLSDILPARELADYIFAKKGGDLEQQLRTKDNLMPFENFSEIIPKLEQLLQEEKN